MAEYKSIDLFAGIGGIRRGFDDAFGDRIETVFVSEWDEPAQKTYQANYPNDNFAIAGDITQIPETEIPKFDICLAGFPCQAFSMAGKHQGFKDDYKGRCRGTLFQDVVRICEYHQPRVIFCENVKGLTIHDKGNTFNVIRGAFEQIGYKVFYKILNSKDFGVPQNRERIYLVCFRNDIAPKDFHFPVGTNQAVCIKDIMDPAPVDAKYYLSETYIETLRRHRARHEAAGHGFGYVIRDINGIAGTIVCGGMGREGNLIVDSREHSLVPTTHIKGSINAENIRKMTPREWARLQGYPDTFVMPLSDVHMYKQFGNSVTVPVIKAIAEQIKLVLDNRIAESSEEQEMVDEQGNKIWIFNKGEWSEAYTFLYLMGVGRIYGADENLNMDLSSYLDIQAVHRWEKYGHLEFRKDNLVVSCSLDDQQFVVKTCDELSDRAKALYRAIKAHRGGAGTSKSFSIPESQAFLTELNFSSPKAPSLPDEVAQKYGKKSDVIIESKSSMDRVVKTDGFSIKSHAGTEPTLFNMSDGSHFVYEVEGCNDDLMYQINALDSFANLTVPAMLKAGLSLKLDKSRMSEVFLKNLAKIDRYDMVTILSEMLLVDSGFKGSLKKHTIPDLVKAVAELDPVNINDENYYVKKVKDFLFASFAGMTAAEEWDGTNRLAGGYIDVLKNGDLLFYRAISDIVFTNYLFRTTKIDRPEGGFLKDLAVAEARAYLEGRKMEDGESADIITKVENGKAKKRSKKGNFGYIYKVDGKYYFDLNLQIRFRSAAK